MSDEEENFCTCPPGRPLSMPHFDGCPEQEGQVIALRQPDTGQPVLVPNEVAVAVDRVFKAYQSHLDGSSWASIARSQGWPSPEAVQAEVRKYLEMSAQAMARFKRGEMTAIINDKLEMLWAGVVGEAKKGKVPSVMAALNILKTQAAINQIDQPSDEDKNVPTVVVPSQDYINFLKSQNKKEIPPAESA